MSNTKTKQTEIKKKTESELRQLVTDARETLRTERFKDKFSRKAGTIRAEKKQIARALTELRGRHLSNHNSSS